MPIYAAARRLSDGLLTGAQSSPNAPNEAAMIAKGVAFDGGAPATWAMVTLTEAQYDDIAAALPGRSFLVNDTVISATPPQLSAVPGTGEVTITCDLGDVGYTGVMKWELLPPDGILQVDTGNAVLGVDTWEIQTGQQGDYLVRVEVELFGVAEIEFKDA